MSIIREVKRLLESRLLNYMKIATENPELRDMARKNCLEEIELAELLIAAKSKTTPLATHMMFITALDRLMPEEVKKLLYNGGLAK